MYQENKVSDTTMLQLANGNFTMIDAADYPLVRKYKWHTASGYVRTRIGGKHVRLHRFLLGVEGATPIVDHINGNTLDNRRANLRLCTRLENLRNSQKRAARTSSYKGVHRVGKTGKWRAMIAINGKRHSLGYFDSDTEAAKVYDAAAHQFFGEFARPNFSE